MDAELVGAIVVVALVAGTLFLGGDGSESGRVAGLTEMGFGLAGLAGVMTGFARVMVSNKGGQIEIETIETDTVL